MLLLGAACRILLLLLTSCCTWLLLERGINLGLKHLLIILTTSLEEEVGSELLVFVTSEVSLSSFMLGETKRLESLNGIHFFLGHSNSSRGITTLASMSMTACTCTSSCEASIWITCKDQVHESARVRLYNLVELWLALTQLLHKLLIETRVLQNSLSDHCKIRI